MKHLIFALLLTSSFTFGQDKPAPDNTKTNQRDRAEGKLTADEQKMNAADRALTQKIRKSVMADKSLSTYAHNVKIISQDGMVTLRGPVRTSMEKDSVAGKAMSIAGKDKVANELEVSPKQ